MTQTDTTIGFVSQNATRLTQIKQRPPHKHYITAVNSLNTLQRFVRVPQKHKNRIRRASKTTFVMPNTHSYRVVKNPHHLLLLDRLLWAYTTSANLSGEGYNEAFAKTSADVIITPLQSASQPSTIYKVGKNRLQRIR